MKHPADFACLRFHYFAAKSSSKVSADGILNADTIVKIQMHLNNVGHKTFDLNLKRNASKINYKQKNV